MKSTEKIIAYNTKHEKLNSGTKLIHYSYDSIPSTQILAREQIHDLDPNKWYLYTARGQSSAIGQHNRVWEAPYGLNIYATYSFSLNKDFSSVAFHIPQITGLSVIQLLESYKVQSSIKWVNDILINQKKVCGILAEAQPASQLGFLSVIVGIGINVNSEHKHLSNISQPATSIKIETGINHDIALMISELTNIFELNIRSLTRNGFKSLKKIISDKLENFNNLPIILDTESQTVDKYQVGIIKGIGNHGELLITIKHEDKEKGFFNGRILRGNEMKGALADQGVLKTLIYPIYLADINLIQNYAMDHLYLVQDGYWITLSSANIESSDKQSVLIAFLLPYVNKLDILQLNKVITFSVWSTLKVYSISQEIEIKLPNDVLIGGKKISKISTEILNNQNQKAYLVTISININQAAEDFKQLQSNSNTSLKIEIDAETNINAERIITFLKQVLYFNITVCNQYGYEYKKSEIEDNLVFISKTNNINTDDNLEHKKEDIVSQVSYDIHKIYNLIDEVIMLLGNDHTEV